MKAVISECWANSTRMTFRVLNLSKLPKTKEKKNCYTGKEWKKCD